MSQLGDYVLNTDVINSNVVRSIDGEGSGGSGNLLVKPCASGHISWTGNIRDVEVFNPFLLDSFEIQNNFVLDHTSADVFITVANILEWENTYMSTTLQLSVNSIEIVEVTGNITATVYDNNNLTITPLADDADFSISLRVTQQ